jgi:hypothetical protein
LVWRRKFIRKQEYSVPKELVLDIDFDGDAPAQQNECKVWLTSDFLEESTIVDTPSWFPRYTDKKDFAKIARKARELMSSDNFSLSL